MYFNDFIVLSACFHEVVERANDVSKLLDFAGYVVNKEYKPKAPSHNMHQSVA